MQKSCDRKSPLKCDWNHPETTCMFLMHFTFPTPPVKWVEIMTHSFTDCWLAQGWNMFTHICASSWLFLEKCPPHQLPASKNKVIQVRAYRHSVATGRHNPYLQCHCWTVSDSLSQSSFLLETEETSLHQSSFLETVIAFFCVKNIFYISFLKLLMAHSYWFFGGCDPKISQRSIQGYGE